jgi:hypothetical protein
VLLARMPTGAAAAGYGPVMQLYGAVTLFELGQADEARARSPLQPGVPLERPDDYQATFLDTAAAIVAAETGDVAVAPALLERLDPLRGRWAFAGTGAASLGFVDLAVARLLALLGQREAAGEAFAAAVRAHEAAGTPAGLARALVHQGRFLGAHGGGALARAAAIADAHGLVPIARLAAAPVP